MKLLFCGCYRLPSEFTKLWSYRQKAGRLPWRNGERASSPRLLLLWVKATPEEEEQKGCLLPRCGGGLAHIWQGAFRNGNSFPQPSAHSWGRLLRPQTGRCSSRRGRRSVGPARWVGGRLPRPFGDRKCIWIKTRKLKRVRSEKNADYGGIAPAQRAIHSAEGYQGPVGATGETFTLFETLCPSVQRNVPVVSSWTCAAGF